MAEKPTRGMGGGGAFDFQKLASLIIERFKVHYKLWCTISERSKCKITCQEIAVGKQKQQNTEFLDTLLGRILCLFVIFLMGAG